MRPTAFIDLHCDTLTACTKSELAPDPLMDPDAAWSLSNLPKDVCWSQCFAIFLPDGLSQQEAILSYRRHRDSFFHQMDRFSSQIKSCHTAADIQAAWQEGKTAALLTVENGSALGGDLRQVEELARDGVKLMTLTWNGQNEIASGVSAQGGLSSFGYSLLPLLESSNILIDVSHLNDQSFWDVMQATSLPLVASHSNARAICPHPRNLTDDQIRALVERGGLIGLNYYTRFLQENGLPQLEDLFRHVAHFLDLGAECCLAFGSDFDGADLPSWLQNPKQAVALYDCFLKHGLSPALCDQLMWGNALSFFEKNLRIN